MALKKQRKKEITAPETVAAPQTAKSSHPFPLLGSCSPSAAYDFGVYRSLREAIPIIDAAINKLVRLIGSFKLECADEKIERELSAFLSSVRVGSFGRGIDAFLAVFFDQLLTYGTAVGEMVTDGRDITCLYNAELSNISLERGDSPLDVKILSGNGEGGFEEVKYPQLLLIGAHSPQPGQLYGNSVLKGLPFVSDILLKIYNTVGINWERMGNVRFAVTYKPQNDTLDKAYAKERAQLVAEQWSRTMQDKSTVRDFVAVGDVSIKAIGADNQILDSEVPVKQMLEQIVAKLGVPPFLLGLSWSTTERMSSQQADILTSEIDAYRRELTPIIERICEMYMRLHGEETELRVLWDDVTLQDITELAQSRYYDAQAKKIISETGGEKAEN